jgi:RNA polymerase sigma-70 factor (ECF subfamily)
VREYSLTVEEDSLDELVVAARAGDRRAAERLVERSQTFLYRLAWGILGNHHAAQDAVQETYLVCLPRLAQLRRPEAILTWLARSLTRICWRPRAGSREVPLERAADTVDSHQTDDATIERTELQELLRGLTATERTVLVLQHVLEMTYEEMAEILDIPLGTVRSRLAAARRRLELRWSGPPR